MNTVDLIYKSFCILKIKGALISCRWAKVWSKAGENNGLIRPAAESVPGLDNREIAPISSPHGIGVEHQHTLASPFGSELTPCSGYDAAYCCRVYAIRYASKCILCFGHSIILNPLSASHVGPEIRRRWFETPSRSLWRHRNAVHLHRRGGRYSQQRSVYLLLWNKSQTVRISSEQQASQASRSLIDVLVWNVNRASMNPRAGPNVCSDPKTL